MAVMNPIDVQINNRQAICAIDLDLIEAAVVETLRGERVTRAEISVGVLDDQQIRPINHQFLGHDWATDAISFRLDDDPRTLVGEVLVSAETAARVAPQVGWPVMHELALYVIHATLHLVGHDDQEPQARQAMRASEQRSLAGLGIKMPPSAAVNTPQVTPRDTSS